MANVFISGFLNFVKMKTAMRTIIITGANNGIGFEAALQMAKIAPQEQIILACRNAQSAGEAVRRIRQQTGHQHILSLMLDLSSLQSVRDFKANFEKLEHNRIIALINNAGVQHVGQTQYTKDGFESTFGTNHLGHFYLTQLLLPFMDDHGSIIFTASDTHDPLQKTGIENPVYTSGRQLAYPVETNEKPDIVGQRRYSTSKLCNILTVYRLQKELAGTNIRVNAFDPGLTPGTGLAQSYPPVLRFVWKYIMPGMTYFKKNTNTPKRSGTRLANLAFAPAFKDLRGIYFSDGKVCASSRDSYNEDYQEELWKSSFELTGLV
jgi:NAD(P)-dependent dehydrogenase (short-subunit alcohol dehydrogenase family)